MFSLSFDDNHRVLLAQFAGVLSSEDIEGPDKALVAFVARHGLARGILDFSAVQANRSTWQPVQVSRLLL
jgi:hypothetical protein